MPSSVVDVWGASVDRKSLFLCGFHSSMERQASTDTYNGKYVSKWKNHNCVDRYNYSNKGMRWHSKCQLWRTNTGGLGTEWVQVVGGAVSDTGVEVSPACRVIMEPSEVREWARWLSGEKPFQVRKASAKIVCQGFKDQEWSQYSFSISASISVGVHFWGVALPNNHVLQGPGKVTYWWLLTRPRARGLTSLVTAASWFSTFAIINVYLKHSGGTLAL